VAPRKDIHEARIIRDAELQPTAAATLSELAGIARDAITGDRRTPRLDVAGGCAQRHLEVRTRTLLSSPPRDQRANQNHAEG
jgi:hypothetical protein